MDYSKFALEEAKRIEDEKAREPVFNEDVSFLQKRRDRLYRRLAVSTADFNGLDLKSGKKMIIENSGSPVMFPCIRFCEKMEYENRPLVDIFIEIVDGINNAGEVVCRAECLWTDPTTRISSGDPDSFMRSLATLIATILKVDRDE